MAKGVQIQTLNIIDVTTKMTKDDYLSFFEQIALNTGCRAIGLYGNEYRIISEEILSEAKSLGAIDETTEEAIINNISISFIDPNIWTAKEIFQNWQSIQETIAKWYELWPTGGVKTKVVKGQLQDYFEIWIQGAEVNNIKYIYKL